MVSILMSAYCMTTDILTTNRLITLPWQDNPTSSECEQKLVDLEQLKSDVSEPEQRRLSNSILPLPRPYLAQHLYVAPIEAHITNKFKMVS